ncbi:MAG: DUF2585 family protein [Promethearchaeota archaeon]|jgi:hypothetical protein
MILSWFWAQSPSEVSQVVFDFFSFAHICMGIVFFASLSLISTLRNLIDPKNFKIKKSHWIAYIGGTILLGIIWEIIENTLGMVWGWKYQNQQDSIINIISDIILVGLGGLICFGFAHLLYEKVKQCEFPWYYLFDSLSFILFFVIYLALEF